MGVALRSFLALFALGVAAFANGTLEVRGAGAGQVRATAHRVRARLRDRLAEVTVEQVFLSDARVQAEGVYRFPLPEGATVSEFAMTMDGKLVKGEVVERRRGRAIYEGIVARRRDPGLLEKVERDLFQARVFPIVPREPLLIRLVYLQLLPESEGTLELRYPLARERHGGATLEELSVEVDVQGTADLRRIACPSHETTLNWLSPTWAQVALESGGVAQERDFLLYVEREASEVGFSLVSHRPAGNPGTFLALLAPPEDLPDEKVLAKDVTYVLDTSGSMKGGKLAKAQDALAFGISRLRPGDRFQVVAFSTAARSFCDGLAPADERTREAAIGWVREQTAGGGTALDEALQVALRSGPSDRLTLVVLLTDGLPTIGESRPDAIVRRVAEANRSAARVFVFGIGFDQNVDFLDRIAAMTRGAREYVTQKQDLEQVLRRFFLRVDRPVLADLRLEFGEGVDEVFPRTLPDLFAGDRLAVLGRYRKAGPALVRLHGTLQGEPVTYTFEGTLSDGADVAGVENLWAERKVAFLLEQIRANGESGELVDEVVRLGTKYSIVTPYTAGLVVEDEPIEVARLTDQDEVDVDTEFEESAGGEGVADAPWVGPSTNGSIGLGGGSGGGRGRVARRNLRAAGGSPVTECAVDLALEWLRDHQEVESTGSFGNVEETGWALLAFLGAGYTDRGSRLDNPLAKNVRTGLRFLIERQGEQGSFHEDVRVHAIVTTAMCEAYRVMRNPRYKGPAHNGLRYLASTRTPDAVWGRKSRDGADDILTTVWALLALESGKRAGLEVDPEAFEGARRLFDRPGPRAPAEVAAVLLARVILGEDPRQSEAVQRDAAWCVRHLNTDEGAKDGTFLQFGTLALFRVGGTKWRDWNARMKELIVKTQRGRDQGDLAGSWDPPKPSASRLIATARMQLCLEVYYRYEKVFGVREVGHHRDTESQR